MSKKNYYFSFLIICQFTLARDLGPEWFHLPENQIKNSYGAQLNYGSYGHFEAPHSPETFEETLSNISEVYIKSLDGSSKANQIKNSHWRLDAIRTNLSLGLTGNLGLFGFGGTKVIQIIWRKKDKPLKNRDRTLSPQSIKISPSKTLESNLSPIKNYILKKLNGRNINNPEKALEKINVFIEKFHQLIQGLIVTKPNEGFRPKILRTDLFVSASGAVTTGSPFLLSVGAQLRLRLEWENNDEWLPYDPDQLSILGQNFISLNKQLNNVFLKSNFESLKKYGYSLSHFRIGLNFITSGEIGIADSNLGVGAFVLYEKIPDDKFIDFPSQHFIKEKAMGAQESLFLAGKTSHVKEKTAQLMDTNLNRKDNDQYLFKLNEKRFVRGLNRSIKLTKRMAKIFNRKMFTNKSWGISEFRTQYIISLSGDLGLAQIEASPSLELFFKNENFY